ncbi:MAG TPA: penicillin-binding protein 1A [Alphaproteobacteria bacterium]|nr:penicillin-binding protein 1A [Alphaproteobacteria bacterium]
MKWFYNSLLAVFSLGFLGLIAGIAVFAFVINYYSRDLPDYSQLKKYEPPIITRIYAGDGGLLAEYAQEKRVFVPIQKIPDIVKEAFLAAEDKNFYEHNGVDTYAIIRAVITNLRNSGSGRRLVGASTITQQVAKNFLLTNEVSYERKIKEAILALRMEKALSKDQLLELYLNEIFLGQRAYGVAAAALTYFNKSLDELTIEEAAFLGALPKAPNNYNPVRHHEAALARRNWVIDRMAEDGYITAGEAEIAKAKPLEMKRREITKGVEADFFAEEVRRELKEKYGQESLYKEGLSVRSSVDPHLQNIAVKALRDGLRAYDERHGWRGPVANLKSMDNWAEDLNKIAIPEGMLNDWKLAVVLKVENAQASIGFGDKEKALLKLDGVRWARKCLQDCYALGPEIIKLSQVVEVGDVIMVEKEKKSWILRQVPKVQGALIALDPHTGRVLAMQGGWTQSASSFNRATQAQRQPGSAFKPFVYLAALDSGFTPSTLVLDAPFVIEQAPGDFWRPTNYSNKYYGPSTIRMGVEKSRNLMTVRLADKIGMEKVVDYATRFGIADQMKTYLSYALGAGETTLLRLTAAYGMLVNGGKKIQPTFIDRIQNRRGETIFSYDQRPCANCGDLIRWDGQPTPTIPDTREQIADEKTAYQIVSILEGVIQRGTARKLNSIGRPLAGKTGTTNESKDTWFVGFSPDLAVGVFVGFDDPKSLGKHETGSSVAAPIWGDFMKEALKDTPAMPFRVPPGIKNVRVNAKTGKLAQAGDADVIWEAFVAGTEPNGENYIANNDVIGADTMIDPYGEDPYGYNKFGYENFDEQPQAVYNDGAVEIYDPSRPVANPDDSFSYFINKRNQQPQNGNDGANTPYQPSPVYEEPRTAPVQKTDPNFTGTGGLY